MSHAPLPAPLQKTLELRARAATCGLFGSQATGKLRKLVAESRELIEAVASQNTAHIRDEASDISFVWATVIGDLALDATAALEVAKPVLAQPPAASGSVTSELNCLIGRANTLTDAITAGDAVQIEAGTRSLTQSWARVIRRLEMDPLELLDAANAKFSRRFCYVLDEMTVRGISPSLEQRPLMLRLWDEAKQLEKLTP
jgi:uncharacterized protein YabN with tetrapyrrole methylase and pyrophosphatase domain